MQFGSYAFCCLYIVFVSMFNVHNMLLWLMYTWMRRKKKKKRSPNQYAILFLVRFHLNLLFLLLYTQLRCTSKFYFSLQLFIHLCIELFYFSLHIANIHSLVIGYKIHCIHVISNRNKIEWLMSSGKCLSIFVNVSYFKYIRMEENFMKWTLTW